MIIVATSYGRENCDPSTHTCICENDWVDPQDIASLSSFLYNELHTLPSTLDSIVVIQGEEIIASYDSEDGLGNEEQDNYLEILIQ